MGLSWGTIPRAPPEADRPGRGGHSKWLEGKVGQWLEVLETAAMGFKEKGECMMCGGEGVVDTGNGTLCAKCNKGVPSLTWGWQVEGFLLLSWCVAEVGGGNVDEGPLHEKASMEKMEGVLGTGDGTRGEGGRGGEVV